MADTWVDHGIEEVDEEVREDDRDDEDGGAGLDDEEVRRWIDS